MTDSESRAYLRKSVISNFWVNLLINGALSGWIFSGSLPVSAWGESPYGPDLIITGFMLSAILSAIVIEIHRRKAASGELRAAALEAEWLQTAAGWSRWKISGAIGLFGATTGLLLAILLSSLADTLSIPLFVALKAIWTGFLAAAIVGPAILLGLDLGIRGNPPNPSA